MSPFCRSIPSVLSMTTVMRPLSAGSITMSSSFCSRLSALCSSLVKLLSSFGVDCIVEATLLRMLSFTGSGRSL